MSVKDKVDAIDTFVRTIKESGVYDDIGTACVMAGWMNLAGALTPLKGAAPTNNGFLAADLDSGIGLKGDGSSKYLNSNRDATDDPQNDYHASVHCSSFGAVNGALYGAGAGQAGSTNGGVNILTGVANARSRNNAVVTGTQVGYSGTYVVSRSFGSEVSVRWDGETQLLSQVSQTPVAKDMWVFARNEATLEAYSDATLSWYSIGSATDLAALDSAVSTLMADLRSIDEQGFEPETVNYLRAVEAADGSFLEGGVKKAINRFIVGLKKDGLWDAIKASCILCGARTISGALVPLAGDAPTAYNFTSANYSRETGLVGVPASSTYIDTNRANNADGQDDKHVAVYASSVGSTNTAYAGAGSTQITVLNTLNNNVRGAVNDTTLTYAQRNSANSVGLLAMQRSSASTQVVYAAGSSASASASSVTPGSEDLAIFRRSVSGGGFQSTDARLAFYSIGSAISDLAALDSRVSTLVSEIAAAIP